MYWGDILYDTAVCPPNSEVTIGSKLGNTFVLDLGYDDSSFRIAHAHSDHTAEFFFNDKHSGHVRMGDKLYSLSTARDKKIVQRDANGNYAVRLSESDKADLVIGHVSFYLDWVKESEKVPLTPVFERRNLFFLLLLLLLVGAVVYFANRALPPPEKPPERLVTLEPRKVRATSPTPSSAAPSKAAIGREKTRDGGAQKGALGKARTKAASKPSAVGALRKANLGSLVKDLTALGANTPDAHVKNEVAEAAVPQQGTGGFSTEGLKQGGGGKAVGIGRTAGQGEGGFSGTGRLGLYGNSSVDGAGAGGGGGATRIAGGLDRDVIESIIRRRLDRIRLCYERQLNFFPKLSGKVAVHFVIGRNGSVVASNVTEDTMKNASVRSCILYEVKSWTFPNPEGGTRVNVDYPFVFESGARTQ